MKNRITETAERKTAPFPSTAKSPPANALTSTRFAAAFRTAAAPSLGAAAAVLVSGTAAAAAGTPLLMAPFGASCVLLFALPYSPLAQPRNVIGGHAISAAIGLAIYHLFGSQLWAAALAVGLAVFGMILTRTVHPPAGANPLLIVLSGASWSYFVTPVLAGSLLLVVCACVYHRFRHVSYPFNPAKNPPAKET